MFTNQVAPLLKEKLPLDADFVCRTLRTVGIGESYLEERIAGPLKPLTDAGLELGYCAHTGAVDVRFVARGCGADADVAEAARIVYALAGEHIFGEGDDDLLRQGSAASSPSTPDIYVDYGTGDGAIPTAFTPASAKIGRAHV